MRRGKVSRLKNPDYVQVHIMIPKDLKTKLLHQAIDQNIDLSALVEQVLEDWIGKVEEED
jgi:hypothetical protein